MATQKVRFTSFTAPTSVKALLRGATSVAQTSTSIATITGTERREVTFTDLAAGIYTFFAYNGSALLGVVDIEVGSGTGTYEPVYPVTTVDVDEAAIASAVVDSLESDGISITVTGPVISDGGLLSLVQGDDYSAAASPSTAITMTINATGIGAAIGDDWELHLQTRAASVSVIGEASSSGTNTLSISWDLTEQQTASLDVTSVSASGVWSVRQVTATGGYQATKKRGRLAVAKAPDEALG